MKKNKVRELEVELLDFNKDVLKSCWIAARNCYQRGDTSEILKKYNPSSAIKLLKGIYDKNHKSIFEHNFFQFGIKGSRSLLAQMTRHRIGWSFAVQSQHFQDHDDFEFKNMEEYVSEDQKEKYYDLISQINDFYKNGLENGQKKYIAREILPNATCCNIIASSNLRALDHFWTLRHSSNNTPEIREVADKTYKEVKKVFPWVSEILKTAPYTEVFNK